MSLSNTDNEPPNWQFIHFGLIVTGKTEAKCLPDLFRLMSATGVCSFRVIRRISQRSPRSKKRQMQMIGRGKVIPTRTRQILGCQPVITSLPMTDLSSW